MEEKGCSISRNRVGKRVVFVERIPGHDNCVLEVRVIGVLGLGQLAFE